MGMSEESGFKILVTNQSNNERIIRVVIAVVLILAYLAIPSSVNSTIALVGLGVAGVLLFNAISGNCYIYRALGINTCPIPENQDSLSFSIQRVPIRTYLFAWVPLANYGYLVPSRFRQNQSKSQGIGHILFDDYMMHEH